MSDAPETQEDAGARMAAEFAAADVTRADHARDAARLRGERATLMADWDKIVASMDFDAITKRSMRLAEIGQELVRLGV